MTEAWSCWPEPSPHGNDEARDGPMVDLREENEFHTPSWAGSTGLLTSLYVGGYGFMSPHYYSLPYKIICIFGPGWGFQLSAA